MFNPNYRISNQIANQLSQIAEIKALVQRSNLLPAREAFLRKAATIRMAHTSTSIEGNRLQEYQVKNIAEGKKIQAGDDQIREVKNYLKALREIDNLSHNNRFGKNQILAIHKTVMSDLMDKKKFGTFRKGPVYIVNITPKGKEELAYTPPLSREVPHLISNLLEWLRNAQQVHPVIRSGLFHYQFETIHPFTDGNGRTGRLMTLLHLYQSGWDFKKILVLEDYYHQNRERYFQALQTGNTYKARQGADLTGWLEYYVEGFLNETNKVKDQILNLSIVDTHAPSLRSVAWHFNHNSSFT